MCVESVVGQLTSCTLIDVLGMTTISSFSHSSLLVLPTLRMSNESIGELCIRRVIDTNLMLSAVCQKINLCSDIYINMCICIIIAIKFGLQSCN